MQRVTAALAQPVPVVPLDAGLDDNQRIAQEVALADPDFQRDLRDPASGAAFRNEIFGVYPLRASDITTATVACNQASCYRVELYNYALNLSTIAFVDVTNRAVLAVNRFAETQPDLPASLIAIAEEIAMNAPEIIELLGRQPTAGDALMSSTKSALNRSRCERSRHLCVAPTFIAGDWALWAIVDLTEGTVVGIRPTAVGRVNQPAPTEKTLQNDVVMAEYCDKSHTLTRDGWQLEYILTSSDGLRVSNVRYQDRAVLDSVKLVDWHVSYSTKEGFGYSDAIGCPVFSQASVVAFNGPRIQEVREGDAVTGFALIQEYRSEVWPAPCNYYYSQRFVFYVDGRFRVISASHGRGCGSEGIYRPVVRFAFSGHQTVRAWDGAAWQTWATEGWQAPSEHVTAEGYQFQISSADGQGYFVEPSRGQFGDGGRGDNPYVYVTRRPTVADANDEGDADLITIGPCCNDDHQQGPEKFIDTPPEAVENSPLVFWYIAQLENDNQPGQEYCWADSVLENGVYVAKDYPCYSGPLFVPMEQP
jgi:hypothetical protein